MNGPNQIHPSSFSIHPYFMKLGILLFNLRGPETQADVRPFLFNLFADPEIVRLPIRALQKPLAWIISTSRAKKSSANYQLIGGGSPLRRITDEQAEALRQELQQRGIEAKVYVGMRYWYPFTAEALDQIERDGITDLVLLPLYPQYSVSTTGSSYKDFDALLARRSSLQNLRRRDISTWFTHDGYIDALASQISEKFASFPNPDPAQIHLLFSAHSVPVSYIANGDPYLQHTEETVQLVSERLGNRNPVHLSFQSKVGPVKWLEPSTDMKLRELRAAGVEQVLAIPISFVSEHIETLYELDILYKDLAEELGLTYRRVPAFNTDPRFISALADLVIQQL